MKENEKWRRKLHWKLRMRKQFLLDLKKADSRPSKKNAESQAAELHRIQQGWAALGWRKIATEANIATVVN